MESGTRYLADIGFHGPLGEVGICCTHLFTSDIAPKNWSGWPDQWHPSTSHCQDQP